MRDNLYKLEGTVKIPDSKKAEFNRYILQILGVCGIRMTERTELDGRTVTVVRRPVPDGQGIVNFDYSIFEKKKRQTAAYNINTCELIAPDRGYAEFGVVMNMIMVMQEAYSAEHCYFMYEDRPCPVEAYAELIRSVLGIELKFSNRSKLWDMLLYLKNTEEYQNITSEMVWRAYSLEFCDFIAEQFIAAFDIDSEKLAVPEEPFKGEKADIKDAPKAKLGYYVYKIMLGAIENGEKESLEIFLRELLDADMQKRQELAGNSQYSLIAETSLYVLPSVIVRAYASAIQHDFWDVWKKMGITGYSEVITEKRTAGGVQHKEDKKYISFYKAIQRDYEDEFIEFWEDGNLQLSGNMKKRLSDWKKHFRETQLAENFRMESFLAQLVTDLDQEWGCRLADQEFITEFMDHREDEDYKRAVLFYRELMDHDIRYFPELTRKQAIQWVLRDNRDQFECTAISAFQSLLINHRHRYEILGF